MPRAVRKRRHPQDKRPSGGANFLPPGELLTLTLYLRHRRPVRRRPGSAVDFAELTKRVTLKELKAERRLILKGSIEQIRRFAKRQGLTVKAVDFLGRNVTLRAKASDAERIFSTRLLWMDDAGERRHYPRREPRLPRQLARIAHAVLGLDTRKPRLSKLRENAVAENGSGLLPSQIARLYGLASPRRGAGQSIAIIEPAGGYDPADVAKACEAMTIPMPKIVNVNVGSGRNAPGVNARADMEVALDIQVVAGVAPEARIVVYFNELSEPGLVAGVCNAVNRSERP
jgi:kumamolisin